MNRIHSVLKTFVVALATVTCSLPCYSWDKKGHDVTAAIAQRHLTKKAQKKISALLDGKTIIYWAPWMDDASNMPEYKYSKTWHYFDIDEGKDVATAPHQEKGDVITAITAQIETLKSNSTSREEKQLAIKFLVHLMGDLHQPMHLGYPKDLGGNTIKVKFFNKEMNLHSVWDGALPARSHDWTHTEWAEELDITDKAAIATIVSGDLYDWARQSHAYSEEIYKGTPTDVNLSFEYVRTWTPVIERQFLNGGLRLAHILNEIFK